MNPVTLPPLPLSDIRWRELILALCVAVIIVTVWCLMNGITIIFMHLYYFPIVLLAYRYRWKGCGLAILLSLVYLVLVIVFDHGQPDVITGAFYRFLVFAGIAAVIAYLSESLATSRNTLQQFAEIRDRYLSLAPAIILVLDRNGAITFLNQKGGNILECPPEEVIGKSWVDVFLPERERERAKQVLSQMIAGQVEQNRIFDMPVVTRAGAEKIIRWYNTAMHDEKGAITGILGFGEDITAEKWAQDSLWKMQQFQESVIANANVWITVLEPDGTLLVWNEAAEAISGYKKTGILGKKTVWKLLYPDPEYRKKVTTEIRQNIGRDTFLENFETEIRCADGAKKFIVWNTRGLRDDAGTITRYITIGRDITDQKSAEFRAGESSRFLATMIDTLPIPVFFKDVEGRYLGCNLPFEDYIGIKRASLIGKTAYDIAPVDLADRYTAADREFFTQPLPQNYETQVQYADGSRHDVIFYKAPFFNKDGSPGGLIGAYIDITGRKVAEEALLESESFNRGLVENLPEYIAVYGIDGKLVYVNPASAKGLGYDADELVGSHVLNYVAAEYHEIVKAKMIARRNDGDTSPYEIDMVTRTGLLRSVIVKATPIQYHNNPAILLLLIDITDRKKSDTVIQRIGQEWQTTFDAITDAVFLLDDTGRIARHNRAFETFTGKTATEIDGRFCYEILHGTAYPFQGCPNVKAPASRKRESLELQIDNRWYLSTVDPILSKNGSSSGAVHLIVDITERKRVEELLQQNQLQLATAMDLAMVVNWEYDVGTGEFTFDDRFYALYGTTAEREGGHRMSAETYAREFVHPEDISRVAGEIQKLLGIADPLYRGQMEHRIIRRDGMIRTVNARYAPVMDTQGKVIRTFGANQDITERKQVEEALRESETQLNEVSEMARVGGWELDLSTKAVRWTRETYRIHEVAEGGTFNLANAIRFYDQPGRTLMEDAVQRCIEHGEPFDLELPFTSARGQHLWTRAMGRAVKIDGKIVKLLGTFQDITERKQAEEVIRSREEQFRVIFHNQQTGLIMVDAENRTVADVNTAALKMIGVSREEILGKVCHTFICPADVGHCPVMDLGQSVDNSERILIRANGEKIPILKSVNPVKINGHPFLIESFIDLSERKKMELQFRESQQLFSDIISFLPDPTFVIDKDGKVLAWNRALEQLSGISAADIIGKGDYEYSLWQYGKRRPLLIDLVLHPDQDAGRMNYTGIRSSGQNVVAQIEITQHGSGHKIPLSLIASPLMDAQGKITGAIESLRDISSLKEAEAELARMNQNLETLVRDRTRLLEDEVSQRKRAEKDVQAALDYTRSVIETNPDLIVVLDDKGTILDINATGEFLTGISKDLLIGTHYFGYLVDDGTLFDTFSALTQKGRLENIIQVRNTSGHLTPLSVHATVIRASDGGKDRIIVAAHDITRQKQDAEAIRASLDEKVLLLREVHHRVKNNLQIIISLVNLQMRQTDDPMVKQIMSETQNRVRAMSLVHEKLYRSESLSRIDFADYTRFLATQLFSFYGTDTRRVHLDFAMREIMVEINTAVPLGLLMNELISNALKHAFPHGREGTITISGGDAGDLVTLIVKDNGIGMPADLDWKDTTSLGMRLVTSLIDQVDGTVTLDRTGGTMFTITIRKKLPQMVPD